MEALLEVRGLCKYFGGVKALDGVDLKVMPGSVHSIVGPNGSGKTTFFNVITGFAAPTKGTAVFGGKDLRGLKPSQIAEMGMVRTFQNVLLFRRMTTFENVLVGRHSRLKAGPHNAIIRPRWVKDEERENERKCLEILRMCGLEHRSGEVARNLPYAEQKRLEIARTLATDPMLILLDEPAAGTPEGEIEPLLSLVAEIVRRKITVVLIEHRMDIVMNISNTITVLNFGQRIAEGTPASIASNPTVIEAYLGRRWLSA